MNLNDSNEAQGRIDTSANRKPLQYVAEKRYFEQTFIASWAMFGPRISANQVPWRFGPV